MGTNYYLQRAEPIQVRPCFHVCKRSAGWNVHFQDSTGQDFEACEIDPRPECPEFRSVADIRELLESGEWLLADENGRTWEGGEALDELYDLCNWDGGDMCEDAQDAYMGRDYRDPEGFLFTPTWFC